MPLFLSLATATALHLGRITATSAVAPSTVGGCLIVDIRSGAPAKFNVECETIPGWTTPTGQPFQSVYADWLGDSIIVAFDAAERALCGTLSCLTGTRPVRFYLVGTAVPMVGITASKKKVEIVMSTGWVDATELAVLTSLAEAVQQGKKAGVEAWLRKLRALGGAKCNPTLQVGTLPGNPIETLRGQKLTIGGKKVDAILAARLAATQVYAFVLGHELAHLKTGKASKRHGAMELEKEMDRIAFRALAPLGGTNPAGVSILLTTMASYQALYKPWMDDAARLVGFKSLNEMFPASDWQDRAAALLNEWRKLCEVKDAPAAACFPGWDKSRDALLAMNSEPLPASCIPAKPGEPPPWDYALPSDPEAGKCIDTPEGAEIDWSASTADPTVRYTMRYSNTCSRKVTCAFNAATGDQVSGDESSWTLYSWRSDTATIPAHEDEIIKGKLPWNTLRDPGTQPHIRIAGGRRLRDETWARCRFIGAAPSTPPGSGAPSAMNREGFSQFAGLTRDSSASDAIQIFGAPQDRHKTKKGHFEVLGYIISDETALTIYVSTKSGTVDSIHVNSAAGARLVKEKSKDDRGIALYGRTPDAIEKLLGPANSKEDDTITYRSGTGGTRAAVELTCYDFDNYACNSIVIKW